MQLNRLWYYFFYLSKSFKIHKWGIYWCIVCLKTKCVHFYFYFRHLTKNPFKKNKQTLTSIQGIQKCQNANSFPGFRTHSWKNWRVMGKNSRAAQCTPKQEQHSPMSHDFITELWLGQTLFRLCGHLRFSHHRQWSC